jgi:hypothetical protein
VTLDVQLAFFPPPPDLWQRETALVRESLGEPRGREARAVLEAKARESLPPWLTEAIAEVGARRAAYSKFEEASKAVHG